jgi:hypothetical protein
MLEIDRIAEGYFFAKNYVIKKGFADEIDWQETLAFTHLTGSKFLEQYAWVVLASGMNDRVVRKVFPRIRRILDNFNYNNLLIDDKKRLHNQCLAVLNHPGKIKAIIETLFYLKNITFKSIKLRIENEGINFIRLLPYMGKATSYHLAKNIGLDVAKPDRHLIRITALTSYPDVHTLCHVLSSAIAEKVSLIDLVLWRYATLDKNYEKNISWFLSRNRLAD